MSDVSARLDAATPGGLDYDLADIVDADSPARLKALGDPLRSTILDLVLERAMTVTELAERVDRPRGSVAHHVDVLVDAGLLHVVRTRRVRAVEERFYGRTARTIRFPGVPGELPFLADAVAEADFALMEQDECAAEFTYRHARIPTERAQEWADRLHALALEFVAEPRAGDVEYALLLGVFPTVRRIAPRSADPSRRTQEHR